MQVDAKTSDNGIVLTVTLTAQELQDSFKRAFNDHHLRDRIVYIMTSETGPLVSMISEHVKVAIANPSIANDCKRAVESGLAAATAAVRDHLHEAGIKAAEHALGHFLGKTFARFRKALAFEMDMQETANSVAVDKQGS